MTEIISIIKKELKSLLSTSNGEISLASQDEFDKLDLDDLLTTIKNYKSEKQRYFGSTWFSYDENKNTFILNVKNEHKDFFIDNEIVNFVEKVNHNDFEIVCSLLFKKLLKDNSFEIRKSSRDDGVDFYGYYECNGVDDKLSDFMNINAWYIGQAKQYAEHRHIGTYYLRELIGTITLAKYNIWSTKKNNYTIKVMPDHNIVPVFITTSRYSSDAWTIAEQFNIKLLDDIDLLFWLTILYKGNIDDFKSDFEQLKDTSSISLD